MLRNQFIDKKYSERRTIEEQKRYEKDELEKNLHTSDQIANIFKQQRSLHIQKILRDNIKKNKLKKSQDRIEEIETKIEIVKEIAKDQEQYGQKMDIDRQKSVEWRQKFLQDQKFEIKEKKRSLEKLEVLNKQHEIQAVNQ